MRLIWGPSTAYNDKKTEEVINMECCPKCGNELEKWSRGKNVAIMFLVGLILWPMLLVAPFMPTVYKCKTCKKGYREKHLREARRYG